MYDISKLTEQKNKITINSKKIKYDISKLTEEEKKSISSKYEKQENYYTNRLTQKQINKIREIDLFRKCDATFKQPSEYDCPHIYK